MAFRLARGVVRGTARGFASHRASPLPCLMRGRASRLSRALLFSLLLLETQPVGGNGQRQQCACAPSIPPVGFRARELPLRTEFNRTTVGRLSFALMVPPFVKARAAGIGRRGIRPQMVCARDAGGADNCSEIAELSDTGRYRTAWGSTQAARACARAASFMSAAMAAVTSPHAR